MKLCLLPTRLSKSVKILIITTFSLVTAVAQAQAFDSYFIEVGKGNDSRIYKLGAQKAFSKDNSFLVEYNLRPHVELTVAKLIGKRHENTVGRSQSVTAVGITPVLRWQPNVNEGMYGEIGIGFNYMSGIYNNAGQVMGGKFQFGDHIGVGYKFSNAIDVTIKFQHYSNGGIKQPNPAINFSTIKLAYSF